MLIETLPDARLELARQAHALQEPLPTITLPLPRPDGEPPVRVEAEIGSFSEESGAALSRFWLLDGEGSRALELHEAQLRAGDLELLGGAAARQLLAPEAAGAHC